jgi:hypothetical protein
VTVRLPLLAVTSVPCNKAKLLRRSFPFVDKILTKPLYQFVGFNCWLVFLLKCFFNLSCRSPLLPVGESFSVRSWFFSSLTLSLAHPVVPCETKKPLGAASPTKGTRVGWALCPGPGQLPGPILDLLGLRCFVASLLGLHT